MLNKVILVGRLTAEPVLKQTANGNSVTSFTVACNRPRKRDGDQQVDFINIVAWRGTAEFVCQYFHKGDPISVDGSIQVRSYSDVDGVKHTVMEVLAEHVGFISGRGKQDQGVAGQSDSGLKADAGVFQELEDTDDLPF